MKSYRCKERPLKFELIAIFCYALSIPWRPFNSASRKIRHIEHLYSLIFLLAVKADHLPYLVCLARGPTPEDLLCMAINGNFYCRTPLL